MMFGTLPPDTQDFGAVLRGIGRTLADRARAAGQSIIESGQKAETLQRQAFPDPNRPTQLQNPQALAQLTDMMMNGPMGMAQLGITAYHGSPYLFRQFDPSKAFTGEGAQAYGHGAGYTAEARPVAEGYRMALTRKANEETTIGNKSINDFYNLIIDRANSLPINKAQTEYDKAAMIEMMMMDRHPSEIIEYAKDTGYAPEVIKWLEKDVLPKTKVPGYLYKGDIPDEILPKFLDWDKPLKDQPEILKAIRSNITDKDLLKSFDYNVEKGIAGANAYKNWVVGGKTDAQRSEILNNLGIRGIRYLDQGSRAEGKGTSNFIPFRPEDYRVETINDIPIEEYYRRGLLQKPMSAKEQAKAAWEANPEDKQLYEAYRKLRLGE